MQQYKISEDAYKKFRKRGFRVLIPLAIIMVIILIVSSAVREHDSDFQTWPFVLPIFFIIYGWSFSRSLKRQKALFLSYTITITDHDITREQFNTPTLTINFMEIKEITKSAKGNFLIRGLHRTDAIHIPYWIENAPQLEEQLQRFAPVTTRTSVPLYSLLRPLISLFALAMLFVVEFTDNITVVITCAFLGTAAVIWALYETYISKNLPSNVKKKSWYLVLLIVLLLYLTYQKLTGNVPFL